MASGGCSGKPVKVVIITTQYVETDATSFKSVVQKLTGKDSDDHIAAEVGKGRAHDRDQGHSIINPAEAEVPATAAAASGHGSSFFIGDLSFKEFDRLLREMPPVNDVVWSDLLT